MIVVRVELWSALTGRRTELARIAIANTGESTNANRGDYVGASFKGRDEERLQQATARWVLNQDPKVVSKTGEVKNHARLQEHVWNLVAKMLTSMGYGARTPSSAPVDMILFCPSCGVQHVDKPETLTAPAYGLGGAVVGGRKAEWTNPPHRSHLCHGCGHIWRPADVPTNGVASIETAGEADSPSAQAVRP